MVFDKVILDSTINNVDSRIIQIDKFKIELNVIRTSLKSIQDEEVIGRGTNGNSEKEIIEKLDCGTRKPYTVARRNEIFDVNVPAAETKLAETT